MHAEYHADGDGMVIEFKKWRSFEHDEYVNRYSEVVILLFAVNCCYFDFFKTMTHFIHCLKDFLGRLEVIRCSMSPLFSKRIIKLYYSNLTLGTGRSFK